MKPVFGFLLATALAYVHHKEIDPMIPMRIRRATATAPPMTANQKQTITTAGFIGA